MSWFAIGGLKILDLVQGSEINWYRDWESQTCQRKSPGLKTRGRLRKVHKLTQQALVIYTKKKKKGVIAWSRYRTSKTSRTNRAWAAGIMWPTQGIIKGRTMFIKRRLWSGFLLIAQASINNARRHGCRLPEASVENISLKNIESLGTSSRYRAR